jgi:hypothetical protein
MLHFEDDRELRPEQIRQVSEALFTVRFHKGQRPSLPRGFSQDWIVSIAGRY